MAEGRVQYLMSDKEAQLLISVSANKDTTTLITEYKKSILSEYAYLTEYTSRAGEQVLLNDRYIDPMIVKRHKEREEKEQEMRSRGEKFFSFRTNQRNKNVSLEHIFSPESEPHKDVPRAVILQGDSGSGKSITAQKIFLDWASGELYAGLFDVVFYLRCQELNNLSGEMSLVEICDCSLTPNEIARILQDTSQRTLFIVDGFDELILSAPKGPLPPKPDIKGLPSTILCSLLKGRMMRDSCLLVTTRSAAVDNLLDVLKKPQSFMEILGFSENGVIEYFRKFFEDEEFSEQVYEQVKVHEMLYTVCFVPVFCWIICTIFKKKGKDAVRTSELTTTTSIFVDFLFTILKHHCNLDRDKEFDLLKSLGQLAETGTPKRQILFHRSSLPKSISDVPNVPFLCTFRQQDRTFLKERFGFMHLSFQEFFCALSYMLTDKSQVKIKVKELLESAGNGRCNDHLLPVIRFLFGLSNKKVSRLFMGEQQRSTSAVIRAQLEKWIIKVLLKNIMDTFYMSDFILHCLYELHDRDVLKNVMKLWEGTGINIHWTLKGIDCQVVMYCLQYSTHISNMELRCSADNLKALHSALCRCNKLRLDFNYMSDTDVDLLTSALGRKKNINNLKIEDGDLSDESLLKILKTLHEQQSVGKIRLSVRNITYTNADLTMNFLLKNMMGKEFSICIASNADDGEQSLCSEFTMESKNNSFWLTVGHTEEDHCEILKKHGAHHYQALSKISFALSDLSTISAVDWRDFLEICHHLRRFSDLKDTEFNENVDLLLSYLKSVPGLFEVDLRTEHLTEIWTSRILSFFHVNPKISHITYKMHDSERDNPSLLLSMDSWAYHVNRSSEKPISTHPCDKPILVKLNLGVPPLEGSCVTWEKLFKTIYRLIPLTEKSPDLNESVDSLLVFLHSVPGLKDIKLWLNSLNEIWAAGLIALFMSCSSLLHLQLSVGCNHVNYIDAIDISFFETPVHKVLPCITIRVTDESENRNTDWTRFFHNYNQLKVLTEYCLEYDERVADLLSVLHSLSGLKDLDLVFRFLTVEGASRALDLLQTNPSLRTVKLQDMKPDLNSQLFRFQTAGQEDSDEESSSSSLSDYINDIRDCDELDNTEHLSSSDILSSELRVHRMTSDSDNASENWRVVLKSIASSLNTMSPLTYLTLTLSKTSGETSSDWRTFLAAYNQCKGINIGGSQFNECLDALLLSLYSLSGLIQLHMSTDSLTENWAPKIFSLCNAYYSLQNICLRVDNDRRHSDLNVCSSLNITKNIKDSM
ncbi:NACHT, LRR and PYD domains-containing protein 3 [Triplophysa tibetana]|uniref:NACHT, LRR and PYD domains-containing protein 3 n=1 Tax=Triplophysa tibetana TaxID=1572043 RepID=A0A5A9PA40_9TELE|nr:NACHT, LRR and PYD domains-containing protein 3 [Triplophysa tibetana]